MSHAHPVTASVTSTEPRTYAMAKETQPQAAGNAVHRFDFNDLENVAARAIVLSEARKDRISARYFEMAGRLAAQRPTMDDRNLCTARRDDLIVAGDVPRSQVWAILADRIEVAFRAGWPLCVGPEGGAAVYSVHAATIEAERV